LNKKGAAVKKYYEENTGKFIRFQPKLESQNIHQALWPPHIQTKTEAANYSNQLIFQEIEHYQRETPNKSLKILDLGCGVGGAVFYLARKLGLEHKLYGLSISAVQVEYAKGISTQFNLQEQCSFIEADFHQLPESLSEIDLAYAIEAFVHAYDANQFFEQVSEKLKPGGRLILIDDFLANRNSLKSADEQAIERFRYGWVLGSLLTIEQVKHLANKHNLKCTKMLDLTAWLKVYTFKERLIRLYVQLMRPFFKRSVYFKSLIGGDARQYCLQKGLVQYRILVFEKE
jgi:ubiquinone/menaquinone biosynthesis C-methylase UbiE